MERYQRNVLSTGGSTVCIFDGTAAVFLTAGTSIARFRLRILKWVADVGGNVTIE
ncbi:hypothetical protein Rcae01_05909 [Novipirellula caenicola]|uniref:Uncharacterized protein n=1 Tax=Novipirellula caenicola TaxID=1536901 RepID=A0ABP9VZZ2_9BACT